MGNIGKTEKKRGRPATGRDPSITIRLPAPLLQWIDGEAETLEISRSEMVLRLIEESRLGVPGHISRMRTAYHEAGHAVVARALDVPVKYATIVPSEGSLGHMKSENYWDTHCRWHGEGKTKDDIDLAGKAHVMIMMAGREAERLVLDFHHDTKGDRMDRRDIRRLAKWMSIDESALEELRIRTRRVIMAYKREIKQVADVLLCSDTIDQKRIDAIMARAAH